MPHSRSQLCIQYRRLVEQAVGLGGADKLNHAGLAELSEILDGLSIDVATFSKDVSLWSRFLGHEAIIERASVTLASFRNLAAIEADVTREKETLSARVKELAAPLVQLAGERSARIAAEQRLDSAKRAKVHPPGLSPEFYNHDRPERARHSGVTTWNGAGADSREVLT